MNEHNVNCSRRQRNILNTARSLALRSLDSSDMLRHNFLMHAKLGGRMSQLAYEIEQFLKLEFLTKTG